MTIRELINFILDLPIGSILLVSLLLYLLFYAIVFLFDL